jgi:hypothetical protein
MTSLTKILLIQLFFLSLLYIPECACLIRTIPPSTTPTTPTTPARGVNQHMEALVDRIEAIDVSSTQVPFLLNRGF